MKIIDAKKEYSGQLKELFETSFGKNYMSRGRIERYIAGGTPFKIAVEGEALMGAILFIPATAAEIEEHIKMDRETIPGMCGGKTALICKCACTYARYQGEGIAKKILEECMKEVEKQGYGAVFTTLWEYNGGVPAEKMFVDLRFQRGEKLDMPWYEDENYICSECGGRCRCNGIVYYKII